MGFVLAHVSDLHVSDFGDTFHDRLRVVKRSANVAAADAGKYDVAWEEAGWRVIQEKAHQGRPHLRVRDPSQRHRQGLAKLRTAGQGLLDDHGLVRLPVHHEEKEGAGLQVRDRGHRAGGGGTRGGAGAQENRQDESEESWVVTRS